MSSTSPEFRHCLSSSFFLFRRDALKRSYRPEDFGLKPFFEPGIDAATAGRMLSQAGIELEVTDKRYGCELLSRYESVLGAICGPNFEN